MLQQWLEHLPIHGVVETAPLLRGVANDVYQLTAMSGTYVLKHFRFDHPYGLDRDQEVRVQQQLADAGLAPQVLHHDTVQGLLLQPYITSPDLLHAKLSMTAKLQILADVSAHIHRMQIDVTIWSLRNRLQRYCDTLARYDADRAKQFERRLQKQRKLIDSFGSHPVFCHNDLAFHHVFVEPQPLVIDWEYSGLGERYFDLASSIQVNQLSQSHMRAFLHAYEGAAGFTVNTTVLADWLALVALTSQLWYELHHHLQKQL
jgi:thiamine kinase-like enzyme